MITCLSHKMAVCTTPGSRQMSLMHLRALGVYAALSYPNNSYEVIIRGNSAMWVPDSSIGGVVLRINEPGLNLGRKQNTVNLDAEICDTVPTIEVLTKLECTPGQPNMTDTQILCQVQVLSVCQRCSQAWRLQCSSAGIKTFRKII